MEARWWEWGDREPGRQGDYAKVRGRDLRIACPSCGDYFIVYNGNYFCDLYGFGCDWALSHPAVSKQDRLICDLIGIDYD